MKINDAVFGAVLMIVGAAILGVVQGYPKIPGQNVGPALFPGLIAAGLIGCGVLLLIGGIRERRTVPWFEPMPWMRSPRHLIACASVVGAVVLYVLLANAIGFLIVSPLLLFGMFVAFGVRVRPAGIVAVLATLVIWYAFYKLLRVPLPWGILERFAF
jgi:putative tricarboxylic transport membrane protein